MRSKNAQASSSVSMASISSCFLVKASLGGPSHSVLTRFGDGSLLGGGAGEVAVVAAIVAADRISSSRGLFEPPGVAGAGAGSGGVMTFEGLRFVGAVVFGLGIDLVLGDRLPCGDEV
jgi:hypothetical protein